MQLMKMVILRQADHFHFMDDRETTIRDGAEDVVVPRGARLAPKEMRPIYGTIFRGRAYLFVSG